MSQIPSRETFYADRLSKFAKTEGVISSLNPGRFPEYVKMGTIKKWELIKSPYVSRTFHSMNWITNTEEAMKKVAGRTGLDIEFERENTEIWTEKVKENYMHLREQRNNSFDELV